MSSTSQSFFNGRVLRGIAAGLLFGALFGYGIANAVFNSKDSETALAVKRMIDQKDTQSALERHFIEQMVPHHQGAIDMARLVMQKSKKPEVRTMAQNILATQQMEIDDMREWYKEWFKKDLTNTSGHAMHGEMGMSTMHGDLTSLATAPNFDLEFVRQMIPHHESAVMMAKMLLATSPREELEQLANNIIATQSQEIADMQQWQEEWAQ